jgi:hypothetical protein
MDAEIEVGKNGSVMIVDSGEISPIELRQMSELEQAVKEQTGLPTRPVTAHPDGHKKSGPDGKEEKFGPAEIARQVRKQELAPRPVPAKTRAPRTGDVEVCMGFDGNWRPVRISIIIHLLGLAPAGYLAAPDSGA